ncbi:hypothetical protein BH23BAC2_BH23BAC2_06310 [soil metagenome]
MLPFFMCCSIIFAQQLEGSYKLLSHNGTEVKDMEVVKIFQDGYFAEGSKSTDENKFISARGGEFNLSNGKYKEVQDFNTLNPEFIGKEINYEIKQEGDNLIISDPINTWTWKRISNNKDDLTRNWVITGRERNGELSRSTPGDRRTVKILSGGRFQWIAFNSATAEFSGTGGGTYTLEDGKYTENIEFFSRDDNRVGASLEFNYEVKDGEWHHKGKSSTGGDIFEIWSPYEMTYKK